MHRGVAILAVLLLVSCKEKPKPPAISPAERGAAFFAPAADRLGEVLVSELPEAALKQYLEETKSADKPALAKTIAKEILKNYTAAMSLTEAQEADYKAGKFDDGQAKKRVLAATEKFANTKALVPKVCQVALVKVQSGSWGTGLQLEFAARLLEGHFSAAKH